MGWNTGRGKVAYSWISPDPVKAGPTLGGVVVVVVSRPTILINLIRFKRFPTQNPKDFQVKP